MAQASDASKSKKFSELAQKRMTRILKGIEGLSKLSASSRYSYTPKQIEQMGGALQKALEHCFAQYKTGGTKAGGGFTFS